METIKNINLFLPLVTIILVMAGSVIALVQFCQQRKFTRIQNLSQIWKKFMDDEKLMALFVSLDKEDLPVIESFAIAQKLRFLGLLEEVALYTEKFKVDKQYAYYLFQWHFTYVFKQTGTTKAFWENLGGSVEMNKPYWSKSFHFAQACKSE